MKNEEARAYRDIEEIEEVMNCDADAETKCKMISNILTAKPHYFKEKEPCTDAISRQAVIDATTKYCVLYDLRELLADIESLPSVSTKNTGRWIPVSERLPENAFGCLVTVEEDDIYGEPQSVIYPEFVGYDGETWNDASGKQIAFEVIAWMPLPQPYKGESEE